MQMKMDLKTTHKFNKAQIRQVLEEENEFITNLFNSFEVPDSIEDEDLEEQFLLKSKKSATIKFPQKTDKNVDRAQSAEDLQQRLETIRNKMSSKKSKPSERTIKKKELKKLKKSKEMKQKLATAFKSIKNEKIKEEKGNVTARATAIKTDDADDDDDLKPDIKPNIKSKLFNEEGKMVFSKFGFAANPGQAKKTKKDKSIKNPKLALQKLKEEKKEINDLIAQGETEKAEEIKKDIAWKKVFDKSDGKKVKDNTTLLHKTIKKKKVEKKKSKVEWKKREEKVEKDKETKQKKRESNLNKKKDEKKKHKLKKAAKRGRVIAGY